MTAFNLFSVKLTFWAMMSSIWVLFSSVFAFAHEVLPTIADFSVRDGRVILDLKVNLEAQLSGINLDAVQDTDKAENVADYDALRALSVSLIADKSRGLVASWNASFIIVAGQPVILQLDSILVPEVLDDQLPRISNLVVSGKIPKNIKSIEVAWPKGAGDLVLRQQGVVAPYTGLIKGGSGSGPIYIGGGNQANGWQTFFKYIPVGFDHILPKGLDHILFVLGLFFLSARLGVLLWQVSAFTLAHTFTLALGSLEIVSVPANIVEPLIAVSIVYVALENLFSSKLTLWRPIIIFGFGLLHGLGFASVLSEFGLPREQFILALIGFNIGVEFGQLTVIAIAFLTVGWFLTMPWYRRVIAVPASCVIASIGAYWVVERVFL